MFQYTVFIVLLYTSVQGELTLENPNFVRTKEMNITLGVTVPFGPNIATASKNSTHLLINIFKYDSTDAVIQCEIPSNTMKKSIIGRLNAVTSDDEIVIWGETSTDNVGEDQRIRFGGVRVKPGKSCEATPVAIPSYQLPKEFFTPLKPVVLLDKGSVSIRHHQQQDCPPCQFQEKDDSFVPTHGATEGKPLTNFVTKIIRLPSGEDAYFYGYNYDNNTAVIRYLKCDGTVINERYIDHPVSVADSSKSLVNVCSEKGVQEILCGQLNDKMDVSFTNRLPLLEGRIVMGLTVSLGPKGGLLAGTLQTEEGKAQKYVVYKYDNDGKLSRTMDFGELAENHVGELYSWYSEVDGVYCLHMHETETLGDLESREVIKCIDAK